MSRIFRLLVDQLHRPFDRFLGMLDILGKSLYNHFGAHRLLVPHIVIGYMGHCGVAHFGLAGKIGLRAGGHADNIQAPLAEEGALALGAEPRAFDSNKGSSVMDGLFIEGGRLVQDFREFRAEGLVGGNVHDNAPVEEAHLSFSLSEVNELIGNYYVTGGVILAKAATGTDSYNKAYAQGLEGVDIGPVVDLAGIFYVSFPVAGQKGHALSGERSYHHRSGGFAEGSGNILRGNLAQAFHFVQAASADNAYFDIFLHSTSSMCKA